MAAVYMVFAVSFEDPPMIAARWMPTVRAAGAAGAASLAALLDPLLPGSCALCGSVCRDGGALCPPCRADLVVARPRCPRCANPVAGAEAAHARECGACLAWNPAFDATVTAADYAPPLDELVLQLKFGGRLPLAAWFAAQLRDAVLAAAPAPLPELLCAVPLARARLSERGFNQALEIARPLARMLGVRLETRLVARLRATATQSSLAPGERPANVRGAFAVRPGSVKGLHVGVVDDVMTSGHTLDALARTLKAAGARRVSNFVVARTPPK